MLILPVPAFRMPLKTRTPLMWVLLPTALPDPSPATPPPSVMLPPLLLMLLDSAMAPLPLPSASLFRTTLPLASVVMPVLALATMSPPACSVRLRASAGEMAELMVMSPEAVAPVRPITSVPAVMRSSSASARPRVSGLPVSTSAPPRLIRVPALRLRMFKVPVPADTVSVPLPV